MQANEAPQLLSIEQTAKRLNVSRTTIYALIRSGRLPIVRGIGDRTLVSERALAALVESLSRAPAA